MALITPIQAGLPPRWRAAEFFAGIGLARLALERSNFNVTWSNDISPTKQAMFERQFGVEDEHTFVLGDLGRLAVSELPSDVQLAWASFPCTDLSVAGGRAGLHAGIASSTFWHLIKALSRMGSSRPPVVALENVTAFATSHSGRDIASAIRSLNGLGYSVDVLSVDARHFVPQSRPRLFLIGCLEPPETQTIDSPLRPAWLNSIFTDPSLVTHRAELPELPAPLTTGLTAYLEPIAPDDSRWWSEDRMSAYVASLSDVQHARMINIKNGPDLTHRTAYRRMRRGVARWEMRDDGISGCLRTSSGGSSKQAVLELGRGVLRARWMTPREYASLMGVSNFALEGVKAHHAYSGFGDAVCVPVVAWLAENYLSPLLNRNAHGSADIARGGNIAI